MTAAAKAAISRRSLRRCRTDSAMPAPTCSQAPRRAVRNGEQRGCGSALPSRHQTLRSGCEKTVGREGWGEPAQARRCRPHCPPPRHSVHLLSSQRCPSRQSSSAPQPAPALVVWDSQTARTRRASADPAAWDQPCGPAAATPRGREASSEFPRFRPPTAGDGPGSGLGGDHRLLTSQSGLATFRFSQHAAYSSAAEKSL